MSSRPPSERQDRKTKSVGQIDPSEVRRSLATGLLGVPLLAGQTRGTVPEMGKQQQQQQQPPLLQRVTSIPEEQEVEGPTSAIHSPGTSNSNSSRPSQTSYQHRLLVGQDSAPLPSGWSV